MRVAFDGRSLAAPVLRGWDRYTIGLVKTLTRRGVEVLMLERKRQPMHAPHLDGIGCGVVALDDFGGLWWEQVAVPLALARLGVDVYHAPAEHGIPLLSPCPTVLTLHSATAHSYADLLRRGELAGALRDYVGTDTHPDTPTPANLYWHAQVRRASWILAPSRFAAGEITAFLGVPPARVTATPLAPDAAFLAPPRPAAVRAATLAKIGARAPYLLYVGGYEPHKNVPALLAMMARLRHAHTTLQLVCIGSRAAPAALVEQARMLGLQPGADVVLGHAASDELVDLYDEAALFVSLSWRESFGLPALEAMTRGVAAVVSAWGAAPEVVGDVGGLVDPRDHAGAAEVVLAMLRDPRRGEVAREAARRFSWERTADMTMVVYERLLA